MLEGGSGKCAFLYKKQEDKKRVGGRERERERGERGEREERERRESA
jgi:hypothetical protein